ncbi:MAG TPA: AAA family ATPase [Desulfomonilaceae bacterium]|nr:AAA family ATPase [Desulfomonilaceae bacterium]
MGTTLAVAGKGGVGKTSFTALMIKALVESGNRPLLAIDADSNSNLHEVLGVKQPKSVGCVREETRKIGENIPGGMTRDRFMDYQIQAALEETKNLDFLSMGRPEGPGCYCMANNILREIIGKLTTNYKFVVIDNEAGMEHLSRRTEQEVDHLFIISDPAPRSLRTIGRIVELIDELGGRVHNKHLVLSRVQGASEDLSETIRKEIERLPYPPEALIPFDDTLVNLDLQGEPLLKIPSDASSYVAVKTMLQTLGLPV